MNPPGFHSRNITAGRLSKQQTVIQQTLGKRIQNLRKRKSLTQEKLAQISGMDTLKLGKVERGEVNIALSTIVHLSKALDTTIARLFRGISLGKR